MIILVSGVGGEMCNSANVCLQDWVCFSSKDWRHKTAARLGESSGEGREERLQDGLHSTCWDLTLSSWKKHRERENLIIKIYISKQIQLATTINDVDGTLHNS